MNQSTQSRKSKQPTLNSETAMRQTALRISEQNAKLIGENRFLTQQVARLEAENRRLAAERDNAIKAAEMVQADNDVLTLRLAHGLVTLK